MKTRWIFIIGALALFLLLTLSGLLYLQTDSFQEFVHHTIVSQIEKNTGMQCRIEDFRFRIYKGRLNLQGLELLSPESDSGFLALKMEEIDTRFSLSSLWRLRMRVNELHLVRPQIELATGEDTEKKEESSWNLEKLLQTLFPESKNISFELKQLTVTDGLIKINEVSSPFNLSLKDLECQIGYQDDPEGYAIYLAYRESRFFYKQRDIVHDLKVSAILSPQGVRIENLVFRLEESELQGSGAMENWNSPELQLNIAGTVTSKHLVLANDSLDEGEGMVDVDILLRYDSDGIYLEGDFFAQRGSYGGMDYTDMSGDLEIVHDILYVRNVHGRMAPGTFAAEGEIQLRGSNNKPHEMRIAAQKIPLVEVSDLLDTLKIRYQNVADSKLRIIWGNGWHTDIDCDAYLYAAEGRPVEGVRSTPLEGNVQFRYYGGGLVDLTRVQLQSPHTNLFASGSTEERYRIRVVTSRLTEPFGLVASFSPSVSRFIEHYQELEEIEGDFTINGNADIRPASDVGFQGRIEAKNGRWQSISADEMDTSVSFLGSKLEFQDLSLYEGRQSAEGDLFLDFADVENVAGFGFQGDFRNVDMSILEDFGISVLDLEGALTGNGFIRFEGNGWDCEGQVSIGDGSIYGEPFDRLDAGITFHEPRIYLADVRILRDKTRIAADGSINVNDRQLDIAANIEHMPLETIPGLEEKDLLLRGFANASGNLGGTWDSPQLRSTFELTDLQYDTWDLGRGEGNLKIDEDLLTGNLNIRPDYGDLAVRARIAITDGYPGTIDMDLKKFNIQKLIAGKSIPYLDIDRTELNGTVKAEGLLKEWDSVEFKGKMDGALFGINDYELKNSGEIEFTVVNGVMQFDAAKITGEGTDLDLKGTLPLNDGPLGLSLIGDLNLAIVSGIQEKLSTSGNASIDISATGSKDNPDIIGKLTLVNGGLIHEDIPFPISKLKGNMLFSEDVVRLEGIEGEAASGTFTLSGAYEHQKMDMRSIQMEITIRDARLEYPRDFNSRGVDANLTLTGDRDLQILAGDVDVTHSEYVRDFNLLERFSNQRETGSGWLALAPALQNLHLNVEFRSNNGLVFDNDLAQVRGSLRLTLRGTPAYPSLTGRVEAVEGTIFFRRNRFEISHAYADFIDRNRINPLLEIRAEADVRTYRLILDVTGRLDNYSVNFTSDPPMSTVDIISLLTTGMADTGIQNSERETQLAGMSAASVLSENLTGVLGERVERIFGLESFRVDPFLAGADNDPTARITISERISRDLVLTFSRNLSTNEEQVVVVEYDIGKGLSVTATRDEDGEFGLDFRLRKRFK